ncbi:MAG: Flp family type IVb pilin [Hyphomicrobiales bacterium]
MTNELKNEFPNDESGGTAIEYTLIAAIISVSIIAAVDSMGQGFVLGVITSIVNGFATLLGG